MTFSTEFEQPAPLSLQSHKKNGLHLFRFRRLSEFAQLEHGVFTRHGGVSEPPFASLNVSYDTGDDASKVRENLRRIHENSGCSFLIYARQSHSSNILILHQLPDIDPALRYPLLGFDGFITRLSKLLLMIKVADCQAVFLYDPKRQVVGMIHVGWRGSVQNILGKAVQLMYSQFDCHPRRIIAAIGPSLGPCCAEFVNWRRELPASFARYQLQENHFDFWAISRYQLHQAGLDSDNIEVAGICNKCHPELFYSYRGESRTGRFAATIALKDTRH
jgi:YfiH family protein